MPTFKVTELKVTPPTYNDLKHGILKSKKILSGAYLLQCESCERRISYSTLTNALSGQLQAEFCEDVSRCVDENFVMKTRYIAHTSRIVHVSTCTLLSTAHSHTHTHTHTLSLSHTLTHTHSSRLNSVPFLLRRTVGFRLAVFKRLGCQVWVTMRVSLNMCCRR